MSTRHLICVVQDKTYKVAQYGQFDGYPEACGARLVEWLAVPGNVRRLAKGVRRTQTLTADEAKSLTDAATTEAKQHAIRAFSRRVSADILEYVASDPEPTVWSDLAFAGDSLMCEWAYVVDLDDCRFEIYKGFNKEALPRSARFVNSEVPEPSREMGYHPVKLVTAFEFSELDERTIGKVEALLDQDG